MSGDDKSVHGNSKENMERSCKCDLLGKRGPKRPRSFGSLLEIESHGRFLSKGIA